ncbi:LPS O-antigen chain length determinant protein WzzB [Enterobacteriaceae bacterium LUAb1]
MIKENQGGFLTQRQGMFERDDEIDLLDVIVQLWNGRVTIFLAIIFFIILAVIYNLVAKEKWVSEAVVTWPGAGQVANYNAALNVLYAQFPQDKMRIADLQEQLFSRFSGSLSALSEELQNRKKPLNLIVEKVIKGREEPLSIKFTAGSAKAAQTQIVHYIEAINDQVVNEYGEDIQRNLAVKTRELIEAQESKERVLEAKKQQHLAVMKQALKIAEASDIVDSRLTQVDFLADDALYLLGTKTLTAMIGNEATSPLHFDEDYYSTQRALSAIQHLKIQVDNLQSFRYIMNPSLPIYRDSPKKGVVLILAAILGMIIGSGIVLGRNMLKNYRHLQAK